MLLGAPDGAFDGALRRFQLRQARAVVALGGRAAAAVSANNASAMTLMAIMIMLTTTTSSAASSYEKNQRINCVGTPGVSSAEASANNATIAMSPILTISTSSKLSCG